MPENTNTPANVQTLKTKLDAMSQPHRKTGKTNLWDVAVSINRTNAVPLDKSSIIFEDAVTKTEGDTTITIPGTTIENAAKEATAYPGQIISGLGGTDGKVYVLQPDDHKHNTHSADAGSELTYENQTQSEKTVYEELATQSDVNYQVNKEAYQRQVANNARKNTETKIAQFILEKDKSVSIDANGDIVLTVPSQLSDGTTTPAGTTVLDYVKATVGAEKEARKTTTKDLAEYIGTGTTYDLDDQGNLSNLSLPNSLSDTSGRTSSTVLGFIQETVQAEKDVRVQATFDLANYIVGTDYVVGTGVAIADNNRETGGPILTGMSLPGTLSDNTSTPSDVTNLLQYIEATVEAEVQKRYNQDKVLLDCINNLDLQRAVAVEETTQDGILTLNLETKLRDSSSDIVDAEEDSENTPLRKYND